MVSDCHKLAKELHLLLLQSLSGNIFLFLGNIELLVDTCGENSPFLLTHSLLNLQMETLSV